jgi:acyl-CoA thioester hydrolase
LPANARALLFEHPLRVYWEDTDAGGIVFYANYLKFFERARTEWLRALGFEQQRMLSQGQAMFVVSETRVRYLRPARLDDWLRVTVALHWHGRASLVLWQQAWRDDQLLAEGEIRVGCVEPGSLRPCRIPNDILEHLA